MKIHYTGKLEKLDAPSQKKLDVRLARLGKLLDGRSEKELHIILKSERHLQRAELTLNVGGHPQAGIHAATDQLTALSGACDKLERQLLKHRDKRLAVKRRSVKPAEPLAAVAVTVDGNAAKPAPAARIYRVAAVRKPMTVDEALLELESGRGYVAYRDANTSRLSLLIRRKDGHFDLIES
jgi:putative sigma-54 modulation protein